MVDFVICGTQKGGTTALDSYLREHPKICMGRKKEIHFFDKEEFFQDNNTDYTLYHSWFSPKPSHILVGEATPIYMYWHDAPKRIWQYNPSMKLIVLLRNPIERAYSHWNMARSRGNETLSFFDAIQNEHQRCRDALPYQHRRYSYVDRGFYLEQLRRLWFYFTKENVLVLKSEDLKGKHDKVLKVVCEFLGVDCFENVTTKDVHSRHYESKMNILEKKYLQNLFEHEIRNIERVLGWDCANWLSD